MAVSPNLFGSCHLICSGSPKYYRYLMLPAKQTFKFIAITASISLAIMIVVDYMIGPKAEFLNAWSVIQRLIGQTPSAGPSLVYRHIGGFGEFMAVLIINGIIGWIITIVWRKLKSLL